MAKKAGVSCGIYRVEVRRTAAEHEKERPRWTPAAVEFLVVREGGRRVCDLFYFPWQAEQEAALMCDELRGCPEIAEGLYEVRVRCEKPAEGVPEGPFSRSFPWPLSGDRRQDHAGDGRLWRWEAQPDPEGTTDFAATCEDTGEVLHPINSQRRYGQGFDRSKLEAPEQRQLPGNEGPARLELDDDHDEDQVAAGDEDLEENLEDDVDAELLEEVAPVADLPKGAAF